MIPFPALIRLWLGLKFFVYGCANMVILRSLEQLSDLSKYQPTHADGAVVAWPSKTSPNQERLISIKIDANVLAKKEGVEEPVEEKKEEEPKKEEESKEAPAEKKADEKDEL